MTLICYPLLRKAMDKYVLSFLVLLFFGYMTPFLRGFFNDRFTE